MNIDKLSAAIRDVPDFPKPGIVFKDITPILQDPELFCSVIDHFADYYADHDLKYIAGIDARGFILGAALAYKMGLGFIPIRKKGKLPFDSVEQTYDLEYGTDTVEIQADAIEPGQRVVVIDDLLATGGTMNASTQLLRKLGADVRAGACIVELTFLKGRQRLDIPFTSLVQYDS